MVVKLLVEYRMESDKRHTMHCVRLDARGHNTHSESCIRVK
jgi:hypothetical protein